MEQTEKNLRLPNQNAVFCESLITISGSACRAIKSVEWELCPYSSGSTPEITITKIYTHLHWLTLYFLYVVPLIEEKAWKLSCSYIITNTPISFGLITSNLAINRRKVS